MSADVQALDLLGSMVAEDGRRWGDAATDWQWACARELLDPMAAPFRWESRPRGGSKTSDVAGIVLTAMVCLLRPGAMCDAYAAGKDQARLLVDSLNGFVQRTPGLGDLVAVDQYRVRTKAGVVLEVMSADLATAYGRRPSFAVVDELCQWPATPGARGLWEAIVSSLPKVAGARLAVITTAGAPAHWSRKVRDGALVSPSWSVAEIPGPLPWVSASVLAEQRRLLSDSGFARFMLNEWTAPDDSLVSPDDLAAAVTLSGPQEPKVGVPYVAALDVGLTNDRTVAVVCHSEPLSDGRDGHRVVLDRMQVWAGSRSAPVRLGEVEEWLLQAHRLYSGARLVADPWQAVGLLQRLAGAGMQVEEFTFSAQSVGRVASELMRALRDRRLALPDDEALLAELGSVRLRESSAGVVRLDHDASGHDDMATALGLAVLTLSQQPAYGRPAFAYYEGWDPDNPPDFEDARADWRPLRDRVLSAAEQGFGTWANTADRRGGPWWAPSR